MARLHAQVPDDVECPTSSRRRQPRTRALGDTMLEPVGQRSSERLLGALLGAVQVAGDAHRRGEHEGPLATVRISDGGRDARGVSVAHAAAPLRPAVSATHVEDGPDLDAAEARRHRLRDGERDVQVGSVDEVVAT